MPKPEIGILSPLFCQVRRLVLQAAFLWFGCTHRSAIGVLVEVLQIRDEPVMWEVIKALSQMNEEEAALYLIAVGKV